MMRELQDLEDTGVAPGAPERQDERSEADMASELELLAARVQAARYSGA